MKSLSRIIQWILGVLGAGIALAGSLGIGASQVDSPYASLHVYHPWADALLAHRKHP